MRGDNQLSSGRGVNEQIGKRVNGVGMQAEFRFVDTNDRRRRWIEEDDEKHEPAQRAV